MRWRTGEFMNLSVIKHNLVHGYITDEQAYWMIDRIERLQDELHRQYKHEDRLLDELSKYRKERF